MSVSAKTGCTGARENTHSPPPPAWHLVSRAGSEQVDTEVCPGDKCREGHVFRSQRNRILEERLEA